MSWRVLEGIADQIVQDHEKTGAVQ